jgi:hypothetical protein
MRSPRFVLTENGRVLKRPTAINHDDASFGMGDERITLYELDRSPPVDQKRKRIVAVRRLLLTTGTAYRRAGGLVENDLPQGQNIGRLLKPNFVVAIEAGDIHLRHVTRNFLEPALETLYLGVIFG